METPSYSIRYQHIAITPSDFNLRKHKNDPYKEKMQI